MAKTPDYFHPLIDQWFNRTFTCPTDIQQKAWPRISAGKNVLITAPTGSGKTLTAFLWSLNRFAEGELKPGVTSVLYVSPLKALNNDIRNNLERPLKQIKRVFEDQGEYFPDIRVQTRSGDTSQEDRRRMFRHPPEILITTPESLNLLLSSKSGRDILNHLSTVILDEIHAVAGTKRGVHLMTAVDRLVRLSGEFQRICLSATVRDKDAVARFVGGYQMKGSVTQPVYTPRRVEQIESDVKKTYHIRVRYPDRDDAPVEETVWDLLADDFKQIVAENRSTLFFTNGRKLCEKMTYKLNSSSVSPVAYSHHGSLSRQLRETVEQYLKSGELKAIVATSSLEMGIDIGSLDEVVLVQSPPSVSSAVQRIGRAGHHVGEESRGTIFCAHAQDLIAAAVLAKAIPLQDIESMTPIECPLDVLAQVLISMACMETWDMDELYAFIRTSSPFHNLPRTQFDLVLNMLAGRYAETRIRELLPRVSIDRLDNTVQGKKGALLALYTSGGTIPDRGYFKLRHHESGAFIGELDEEYVWEAKIGQIATVGTQNWKITRITHNDVFALPAGGSRMDAPFWIAEGMNRDFHFSGRILDFLEQAQERLEDQSFKSDLIREYHMEETAAKELIRFLKQQEEVTQCDLPHRRHILLEYVRSGPDGGSPGTMLVIHTLWGGRINRPFALALEAAWIDAFNEEPEIFPGNDAIVIQLPTPVSPEKILSLVPSGRVEELLKLRLERSGFFSARFRECAGRALLVIKNKINQRMPLWMTRLKSKKLLENILKFEDFPILLETWRTCFADEFDMETLGNLLQELESGAISWSQSFTSRPSPFAAGMAWNQINQYMYKEDEGASGNSSLGSTLVRDLVFSPGLRPPVSKERVEAFERKRQRLEPGYSPSTGRDLVDWIKERLILTMSQWNALTQRIVKDHPEDAADIWEQALPKLIQFYIGEGKNPRITAFETADALFTGLYANENLRITDMDERPVLWETLPVSARDDYPDGTGLLGQWLQYFGPVSTAFVSDALGIEPERVDEMLEALIESQQVISGQLVKEGPETDSCDAENFEILLRLSRARAVPPFEALDISYLPLFLAGFQGIHKKGCAVEHLFERLEQLAGLPMPVDLVESDILPVRIQPYVPSFMDTILQEGDMMWLGVGNKKIVFTFSSDLDFFPGLLQEKEDHSEKEKDELVQIVKGKNARYNFKQLMDQTGLGSQELTGVLWENVWDSRIVNDTFSVLRKGIETKFRPQDNTGAGRQVPVSRFARRSRPARKSFSQWKGSQPFAGFWYQPEIPRDEMDELEREELNKDRVRLLLDRYGILFRELLARELPDFTWPGLFRSLRLMELSGEILAGHFFTGIPGLQFISHKAFRTITAALPENAVFFMNAADPASVSGLPLDGIRQHFPKRLPSNHMVFKGKEIKLVSTGNGKHLQFFFAPDDKNTAEYLSVFTHLLTRPARPLKKITIETINEEPAAKSAYIEAFETVFNVLREFKTLTLYRQL